MMMKTNVPIMGHDEVCVGFISDAAILPGAPQGLYATCNGDGAVVSVGLANIPATHAITQARVAAAFEAWLADRNSNGPSRQSGSQGCMGEGDTRYAKRLAAGLFKYLEGV